MNQEFTYPYRPLTNGTFKRNNASIVPVLRKIASANYQNWNLCLPAALLAYQLSVHQITWHYPFAMLYRKEAMTPFLMFPALMAQDEEIDPEKHLQQLADAIVFLQSTAYSASYKTNNLELTPAYTQRDPLNVFKFGNLVL